MMQRVPTESKRRKPKEATHMTLREFYLERRQAELPIFLRVLKSLPAEALSYKPHDRSPSAQQIVWTLTNELRSCLEAATQFKAQWHPDPPPPLPEMLALFEKWSNDLTDAVAKMDEGSWNRIAQFYYNGKMVSEQPVSQFLWFIHFDAIHHRGQLAAYLRPMGATVPSIYGPSADSRPA
jgi:uncharacterized damage-inducible protein DinB